MNEPSRASVSVRPLEFCSVSAPVAPSTLPPMKNVWAWTRSHRPPAGLAEGRHRHRKCRRREQSTAGSRRADWRGFDATWGAPQSGGARRDPGTPISVISGRNSSSRSFRLVPGRQTGKTGRRPQPNQPGNARGNRLNQPQRATRARYVVITFMVTLAMVTYLDRACIGAMKQHIAGGLRPRRRADGLGVHRRSSSPTPSSKSPPRAGPTATAPAPCSRAS